ncbi:MAG: hypothetical protein ACKO57_03330 [Alphaproteobacteria bacterium]
MTQLSFDAQLANIRGMLEQMRHDTTQDADPALLHTAVAALCDMARALPSSDRPHAATLMEALLADIDTLIATTREVQDNLAKKLDHVRPHRQAVAAFLKASKTD